MDRLEEDTQHMGALKLCPFCGGTAKLSVWYEKCADDSYIKYAVVSCCDCGAVMFGEKDFEDSEKIPLSEFEKVFESWNRRAGHGKTDATQQ